MLPNRRDFIKTLIGGSFYIFLPKIDIETPWKKRIITPSEFQSNIIVFDGFKSYPISNTNGYYYTCDWMETVPYVTFKKQ